ncbi:hypothetical protein A7982_13862 [Minicystis rosea]|nr:hypothetical protein A7982_13862 [Minicystis rosea]
MSADHRRYYGCRDQAPTDDSPCRPLGLEALFHRGDPLDEA